MCVYCRIRPADHLDHIVPISRGGANALANIAPACTPCGTSKGALTVAEWVTVLAAEIAAGCGSPVAAAAGQTSPYLPVGPATVRRPRDT
ncbi:HNH endonuclease signature motif containing protein [Frankia sp. CcI49]|uniref:HNH endonuclease n=1 Tax=Frankia sp. CcI49 TaxID=1745382 RepID=UPI0009FB9954|nr:HNH endonuclease signature motif containing protein [Frankia sp. CcI49]